MLDRVRCGKPYHRHLDFLPNPCHTYSMENQSTEMKTTYEKRRIGIQLGTCATDAAARKLDCECRDSAKLALDILSNSYPGLKLVKKLQKNQIPGNLGACQPDGGLWFLGDKLVAVFEAKKQGNGGNAIERWFKNNFVCRLINSEVSYVTFATGPGASLRGNIHSCLAVAHLEGVNKINPKGNSLFLQPEGFTKDEIVAIMVEVISRCA